MAARYQIPEVDFNEDRSGSVRIRLRIEGIKPGSSGIRFPRIFGRHPPQAAQDNARVSHRSDSRSLQVTVDNAGGLDGNYRYHVQELPHAIVHGQTRLEVLMGWVHVHLKKKDPGISWERDFRDVNSTLHPY